MSRPSRVNRGVIFGYLVVRYSLGRRRKGKKVWICECECGKFIEVREDYLTHTNSPKTHCGCKTPKPGLPTLYSQEYHIHNSMMRRCYNKDHVGYADYGGRGIRVCGHWHVFEQFLKDMGPRPSPQHSLDRINPDKGYEPGNCRWATAKEQSRNKRNSLFLPHPHEPSKMIPAAEVAEILGLRYQAMRDLYIRKGLWPEPKRKVEKVEGDSK